MVGAINVDRCYRVSSLETYRKLPWWPRAGEGALADEQRLALERLLATSVDIIAVEERGGGQTGNFAVALAECDVQVALFAAVGQDAAASIALADLDRIDLSLVHRCDRTTEAFIFVDVAGQRDILLCMSDEQLPPRAGPAGDLRVEHVHFTSLSSTDDVERQYQIASILPQQAIRSLDIGALYAAAGRGRLGHLLRGLDILFATRSELETFAGARLPAALGLLFADGVKTICCKRGPAGASLYESDGSVVECDAPQVRTVDTTGAGDVFAAVFVAACLHGAPRPGALRIATKLASKSVTAWGRAAYPKNRDFRAALRAEAATGERIPGAPLRGEQTEMSNAVDRIAWLTSARDQAAVDLLHDILQERIRLDVVVCAVRKKRKEPESERDAAADKAKEARVKAIKELCDAHSVPFVTFPSTGVKQEYQRRRHDQRLAQLVDEHHCQTIVLAGYMKKVTPALWARGQIVMNLHPAPPLGPTGKWEDVMWALISVRARLAGGMLHIVTEEVDRGPVVGYYTVPLDDSEFDPLWSRFAAKARGRPLSEIKRVEGKSEPLFKAIRERQFLREAPLLIVTLKGLVSGKFQIVEGVVLVDGTPMQGGACLNDEVEAIIQRRQPI